METSYKCSWDHCDREAVSHVRFGFHADMNLPPDDVHKDVCEKHLPVCLGPYHIAVRAEPGKCPEKC